AGALAIDAPAAPRAQLMLDLLAPREIAACDEMREARKRAARTPLRIEPRRHRAHRRPQILLETLDLGDAPELVDANDVLVQPHHRRRFIGRHLLIRSEKR